MNNGLLTGAELDALFDGATESIWRLETLPVYDVDEEAERIAAWRTGRPRPEQSVRTSSWLAEIAAGTLSGVRWERVRVVDDPPTEYERYQYAALAEMQAVGCSVRVLPRVLLPAGRGDCWVFDGNTQRAAAAEMLYTDGGRYIGAHRADADVMTGAYELLSAAATPLNEYLAAVTSAR